MLMKDIEVEKVVRLPEGRKDESSKKKFIFNSKGKITKEESEELQRTHRNIFSWVQKEKRKAIEKDTFELEQTEVEVEVE